jgi:hypothetical protein
VPLLLAVALALLDPLADDVAVPLCELLALPDAVELACRQWLP